MRRPARPYSICRATARGVPSLGRAPRRGPHSRFRTSPAVRRMSASATSRSRRSPAPDECFATRAEASARTSQRRKRKRAAHPDLARTASLMKRAPTPASVRARVFRLTAPGRLRLSGCSRAEQQPGHRHRGSFAVQAVACPRAGRHTSGSSGASNNLLTAMRLLVVVLSMSAAECREFLRNIPAERRRPIRS